MERGNMNAKQVIHIAEESGLYLDAKDGKLIVAGNGNKTNALTPAIRDLLVKWKPHLLVALRPKLHILNLVVDGKGVTCIDNKSADLTEAIAKQKERWGDRLTSIETTK
jgi:hypothetical protein